MTERYDDLNDNLDKRNKNLEETYKGLQIALQVLDQVLSNSEQGERKLKELLVNLENLAKNKSTSSTTEKDNFNE